MFITFEGIDGSGKTTQINETLYWLIHNYPERMPYKTREPFALRDHLNKINDKGGRAMIMAFMADRAYHYEEFIKRDLDAGSIVLCDRWVDSTRVYQNRFDWEEVRAISEFSCCGLVPDLTILLDMNAIDALNRIEARGDGDRFDKDELRVHMQRNSDYLRIAEEEPDRVKVVYGVPSKEKVQEAIREIITEKMNEAR